MGNLETKYSDLLKLELELSNSAEKKTVSNCESIGQIYSIFIKSHEILDSHFGSHHQLKINQAFMTRDTIHKYELDFYLNDLIYYLYTFLSSCKSLVDQTRIHCKKHHQSNELFPEYNAKVKEMFSEDPLTKFVEGLRNFIVHYDVLTVVSGRSFDDIKKELSVSLYFDKQALLNSGWDWDTKGREYLEKMDEREPMQGLIAKYYNKVVEFHKWYKRRQYEIFKHQYDHVNTISSEIQSKGITLAYESFEKQKSFTRANFEHVFFKYLYSKDVREIMSISDPAVRGVVLYNKLKEIKPLPPLLIVMIVTTFGIDIKTFKA